MNNPLNLLGKLIPTQGIRTGFEGSVRPNMSDEEFQRSQKRILKNEKFDAFYGLELESLGELMNGDFDQVSYVINLLEAEDAEIGSELLVEKAEEYEKLLDRVSWALTGNIVSHHTSVVGAMGQVFRVDGDLKDMIDYCRESKVYLRSIMHEYVEERMKLLATYRRRENLMKIVVHSEALQRTFEIGQEIETVVYSKDYERAIKLIHEFNSIRDIARLYSSLKPIVARIEDHTVSIKEGIESLITSSLQWFDEKDFEKAMNSYILLDDLPNLISSISQLCLKRVELTAFDSILPFGLTPNSDHGVDSLKKNTYETMCGNVPPSVLAPCFSSLLFKFYQIMCSMNAIIDWHKSESRSPELKGLTAITSYYENTKAAVWDEMQRKVAMFLNRVQTHTSKMNIESYLHIFNMMNLFSVYGRVFSNRNSQTLAQAFTQQSKAYFESFHKQQFERLRPILENEIWKRCPVPPNFTYEDIAEIRSFLDGTSQSVVLKTESEVEIVPSKIALNPFEDRSDAKTTSKNVGNIGNSQSDSADTQEKGAANKSENQEAVSVQRQSITSTSVSFAKQIGNYLQMLQTFPKNSKDVLSGVTECIHFFVYAIYSIFFFQKTPKPLPKIPTELLSLLAGFHLRVNRSSWYMSSESKVQMKGDQSDWPKPIVISSRVTMDSTGNLFGFLELVSASESLMFIMKVLNGTLSKIQSLVDSVSYNAYADELKDIEPVIMEIRKFLYVIISSNLLSLETYEDRIMRANWNVDEFDRHHPFVDFINQDLTAFSDRMRLVIENISDEAHDMIWNCVGKCCMQRFFQGIVRVSKCSQSGRALMSLDFKTVVGHLEKLSSIKAVPDAQIVEFYIQGFYLQEDNFIQWARDHPEFTQEQLISLLNLSSQALHNRKPNSKYVDQIKTMRPAAPSNPVFGGARRATMLVDGIISFGSRKQNS